VAESANSPQLKESVATRRWQARLRVWMQFIVTGVMVFFLLVSGVQIYYLHQKIDQAPALDLTFSHAGTLSTGQEQWRTLAELEIHAVQQRYHQANVILMARIWTTYLGFVTGMILAVVGAAFILGKLREQSSEISGKAENWQLSIASTSPGLIMVVLGTLLMLLTISTHHEIVVKDSPIYLGAAAPQARPADSLPGPSPLSGTKSELTDALRDLGSRLPADSSAIQ
jgi:ABC-type uncharacterized transport system fused permease/ATPase subunit